MKRCSMAYLETGYSTKRLLFLTFNFLFLTSYFSPTHAAVQWNMSVVESYYMPRLNELNYILRYTEVELGPRNTEAKPFGYPVIYQGVSPDNMPEMRPSAPKVGLQLEARLTPRYSIVFGGSTATFDSTKRDTREFFVGFPIPSARETRFSLSLNQIWIGGRRYWEWEKDSSGKKSDVKEKTVTTFIKDKTGFFVESGILTVTRAYLTTDVWMHVYAPDEGFDFYKVTETGISGSGYAAYAGLGGEYKINKWLSFNLSANYVIGRVTDMKFVHYFTVDPLEEDIIKNGDKATVSDYKRGSVLPLILNLEGVDIKGEIKVHF